MPVRHARSETRGRPPCGRRGGIGKNGSTRSHNGSGSNVAAIRRSRYFADEDQVSEVLLSTERQQEHCHQPGKDRVLVPEAAVVLDLVVRPLGSIKKSNHTERAEIGQRVREQIEE